MTLLADSFCCPVCGYQGDNVCTEVAREGYLAEVSSGAGGNSDVAYLPAGEALVPTLWVAARPDDEEDFEGLLDF